MRDAEAFAAAHAFAAHLRDGTRVQVRPVVPGDKQALRDGLRHLSPASQYLRFLQPKETLTDAEAAYLTELDYVDHFAWGARAVDEPGAPGIGIARYVRDRGDPEVAEAAIAVVDAYQRRGLGRILLQTLAESAVGNDVARFRALVAGSNRQVLEALTALGATVVTRDATASVLELPLPFDALVDSAMYELLRAAASGEARVWMPSPGAGP